MLRYYLILVVVLAIFDNKKSLLCRRDNIQLIQRCFLIVHSSEKIFVRTENVLERKKCTQTRCHLRLKLTRINNFSKNAISLSNERNTVVVVAAAAVYVVFASAVAVVIVVVAVVDVVIDVFAVAAVAIVAGAAHHRKTND